jgi:hypothetical protein
MSEVRRRDTPAFPTVWGERTKIEMPRNPSLGSLPTTYVKVFSGFYQVFLFSGLDVSNGNLELLTATDV